MISSSRILYGFVRFHNTHIATEIPSVFNRHQWMKILPSGHSAFHLFSAQYDSETFERAEYEHKFKLSSVNNNTEKNEKKMSPNQPENIQIKIKKPLERDFDFSQIDPDTFGNLRGNRKKILAEDEGDEGDLKEEMYLENVPSASQKLSIKKYADMIKELFHQKKVAEAIDVLETQMLKEDRVKPDNYIYNLIIGECGRLGYTKKAFQLYNQMKKRALKVTGATYTGLFNSCANSPWSNDGLKRAKHLYDIMVEKGYEPNASNYHAMIKAFGRHGDLSTAFLLVDEMTEKQLRLSTETFNFLFHACITDKEAGFRHALLVWRKMVQKKVKPDLFTYNLLLRSIRDCGLGDLEVAHDVFHRITEESSRQNHDKFSKARPLLTAGNETSSYTEEVKAINNSSMHEENPILIEGINSSVPPMLENRPNLLAVRPHLGNIIALSEVTKPEDRLILVGGCSGFLEQMNKRGVKPNIKTFTQLLDTIPSTKAAEQALLSAMEKADVHPDIDFYNMLIKKRSLRFDYENAQDVLKLIQRAKLCPDIVTFGVLALSCKTQQEANSLIINMEDAGFRMNAEILGAMLRQGCSHFNFEYVLSIMETAVKEEVRPNERFLEHLENFHKLCWQKIKNEDIVDLSTHKKIDKARFKRGFRKFCARYSTWLKEITPDKMGHPWEQFQKKQGDKNTGDSKKQSTNRMRNRN